MLALRRVVAGLALATVGCASSSPTHAPDSIYAGTGFYEPWHWGPVYRELTVVVGPPPQPAYPIAPGLAPARPAVR